MPAEEGQIEIVIEFDEYIAARELSQIIEVVDEAIWFELYDLFLDYPLQYRYFRRTEEPPAFFCVSEASKGSIVLAGIIGGAAGTYVLQRFGKGMRRSSLGPELENLGQIVGDRIGSMLERINGWLREYVLEARESRSRITSVRARRRK